MSDDNMVGPIPDLSDELVDLTKGAPGPEDADLQKMWW